MAAGFPLSDIVSFETEGGWYDLIVTTAYIPAGLGDDGEASFRTVADLHSPHSEEGTATLLQGLVRDYRTATEACAGHAEVLRLVEERQTRLPIPGEVRSERKLRG
ncbi:MAG: hypothetical protein ACR2JY_11375 [Chloroflexota bacterium]